MNSFFFSASIVVAVFVGWFPATASFIEGPETGAGAGSASRWFGIAPVAVLNHEMMVKEAGARLPAFRVMARPKT